MGAFERLTAIAAVYAKPNEAQAFVDTWMQRAVSVLNKAAVIGYETDKLELIYVPAVSEFDFEGLLKKLHEVRKGKGCEWEDEWRWKPLWDDKKEVFGNYGLKDEPQLFVLLRGEGKDGLFFTDTGIAEQITKANEFFAANQGTVYLSPAAYLCTQTVLASESEDGTVGLLDYNDGDYTFTMFPQFSEDGFIEITARRASEDGFIETAVRRDVPYMYVGDDGQFYLPGRTAAGART